MLFAVVREIEQQRRDCKVSHLESAARMYFETAKYVCDNEPIPPPEGDGAIVTNCWLYACETDDPVTAERLALDGRAQLIEACF